MKRNHVNRSLVRTLKRREMLVLLGATTASLIGCRKSEAIAQSAATPACVVRPQQTEGPYFVDENLIRSDIRSDPSDGSVRAGTLLRLGFQVSQVSANACTPLRNAIVDIWHCDAAGNYSDVSDRTNTVGKKFLRGSQVTNADGTVEFVTIYPGWYPGRTVHIHFKIRTTTAQSSYEFTSQIYFDDALTDRVYAQAPYAARGPRTTRNDRDGIYQSGGEQLTLQLTPAAEGYTGRFAIGLQLNA